MDEADLYSIARTLSSCASAEPFIMPTEVAAAREMMLAMLAAMNETGAADPNHDRTWAADMIESMPDQDIKALARIMVRTRRYAGK